MNPSNFFSSKHTLQRVALNQPARKQFAGSVMSGFDRRSSCSMSSLFNNPNIPSGVDYVEEFVKAEEERLYETSLLALKGNTNTLDTISLATGATTGSIADEDIGRLGKDYNFQSHSTAKLTISTVKDKILNMIETNPVVIIQGPTGCGKTTQVPQYILENCFEKKVGCNIIVTQPRRIAAMSIAKRVCEERNWPMGSLVGYKVGLASHTSQDTRLTYCTTGVLLHRLVSLKNMNDFTHVIIDEVHERDQDMDFLLLIVRRMLRSNSRSVKVILMSATINVDKFSKYFSIYVGDNLTNAPIVDITKSNYFDVRDFYLDDIHGIGDQPEICMEDPVVSPRMLTYCKRLIVMLDQVDRPSKMTKQEDMDRPTVLVFLPGIYEIEEMYRVLSESEDEKWNVIILHSLITNEEQRKIFDNPPKGFRRVILSTNIAESSITVPNVKYVIDFCLTKQLVTDPITNFQCLELTWASRANCQQRAGRTGRVMDGRVYRLVTNDFYHQVMPEENPPEILRAPLTNVFLKAKMLDLDKPQALLALSLDPPDLTNLFASVLLLKEAGALFQDGADPCDGELTDLGRIMAELPVDIRISKLIVLGHVFSVLSESIIMGASMATKNMFSTRFNKRLEAYNAKLFWTFNSASDAIAFHNAFSVWRSTKAKLRIKTNDEEVKWARRHYLEVRVLREVEVLVEELTKRLKKVGIFETVGADKVVYSGDRRQFVMKFVIAGAFYPQYYLTEPRNDEKLNVRSIGGLDPTNTIYLSGWPQSQPGLLYAKRFQELFTQHSGMGSQANKISVRFDHSNRVFIQFRKTATNENQVGPQEDKEFKNQMFSGIPVSVYQAIKMRNVGKEFVIPVLDESLASKLAEQQDVEKAPPTIYLPKTAMSVSKSTSSCTIRPILPPLDVSRIPILIKNFIDPGNFWACNNVSETLGFSDTIEKYIKSVTTKLERFEKLATIGSLVFAPFEREGEENVYKRAIVQHVSMESKGNYAISVFFVDNGRVSKIPLCDLRRCPLNNTIDKIPALVFQCILANIRPSSVNNLSGKWSKASKKAFQKMISPPKQLYANIHSVVDGIVFINLIAVDDRGNEININENLMKEGYGENRVENFLSKENHELRLNCERLSEIEKFNHEEMQHNQLYLADTYVDPPSRSDCINKIRLSGPYSPLEVKLTDLTNIGLGMKVVVHDSSVNSVLLNPSVYDVEPKLFVAGGVSQGAKSNTLSLRNTTLMPSIPGLTALIALIFAPKVELRCNTLKTRNTGALCGLGHDAEGRSLFPEHDMYIDFDVEISIDDLQNINRLRYSMSMAIFVDPDPESDRNLHTENALKLQNTVKDVLFKIIDEKRKPVPRDDNMKYNQWCRYRPSMFMKSKHLDSFRRLIFGLHSALNLGEQNADREMMISHLEDIRRLAGESITANRHDEIECKLCNQTVYGVLGLRSHIFSVEHRLHEVKFVKSMKK